MNISTVYEDAPIMPPMIGQIRFDEEKNQHEVYFGNNRWIPRDEITSEKLKKYVDIMIGTSLSQERLKRNPK